MRRDSAGRDFGRDWIFDGGKRRWAREMEIMTVLLKI